MLTLVLVRCDRYMRRLKIALEGYMIDAISMELSNVLARVDNKGW